MPRRYRRRRRYSVSRPLKVAKYSAETASIYSAAVNQNAGTNLVFGIVPPVATQGTRKVKNFTTTVYFLDPAGSTAILWALIYIPEGTNLSVLRWYDANNPAPVPPNVAMAGSIYEPNQNVIQQGIAQSGQPLIRLKTRLARNLNSGDGVAIVFAPIMNTANAIVACTVNYAISFN